MSSAMSTLILNDDRLLNMKGIEDLTNEELKENSYIDTYLRLSF
jgi:hypothetical protein